ncbi:hypothetical protein ES703_86045 [subsurface metagenome]
MLALAGNRFVFPQQPLNSEWGYLVNMGVNFLNSTKLLDEPRGIHWAHTGDAGNIVRWVADETFEVGNLFRLHSVFPRYRCLIKKHRITEALSMFWVEHLDVR